MIVSPFLFLPKVIHMRRFFASYSDFVFHVRRYGVKKKSGDVFDDGGEDILGGQDEVCFFFCISKLASSTSRTCADIEVHLKTNRPFLL